MDNPNKKVLLVDDDDNIRTKYAELLTQNGLEVIEAKDGVEGLDIATSKEEIDLVFTGIIMPRMDGFQLIQSLKEYSSTANIPVIVNSHLGREEDRKRMNELGARDFIVEGITAPVDIVKRTLQAINQGEYNIPINCQGYDIGNFSQDYKLPEELKCEKCGVQLALNLKYFREKKFIAQVKCPDCNKIY